MLHSASKNIELSPLSNEVDISFTRHIPYPVAYKSPRPFLLPTCLISRAVPGGRVRYTHAGQKILVSTHDTLTIILVGVQLIQRLHHFGVDFEKPP